MTVCYPGAAAFQHGRGKEPRMQGRRWIMGLALTAALGCAAAGEGGDEKPPPPPLETRTLDPKLAEIAVLEQAKDRGGRLQALLEDGDAAVRLAAVRALAHIRHAGDAEALAGRFADPDLGVVRAALFATGLLQTKDERAPSAPVLSLLTHDDAGVRAAAVEAAGRIGDHTALEPVIAMLRDKDALVRGEAALALWRMQQAAPKVDAEKPDPAHQAVAKRVHDTVLPIARKAGNEPDAGARWKMCYAVAAMRRSPQRSGPEPVKLEGDALLELRTLVKARLTDGDALVRGYAALAAGRVYGEQAGPLLTPLLQDADYNVQIWALHGLTAAEDDATVEAIRAVAGSDAHPQVRRTALEKLAARTDTGCEAVVVAALEDGSPTVRRAAMGVWASLKKADAVTALARALDDPDPWTRAAAIAAIGSTLAPPKTAEGETPPAPAEDHVARVAGVLQVKFTEGDDYDRAAVMSACGSIPVDLACDLLDQGCRVDVLEIRGSACSVIKTRAEAILEAKRDLVPALNAAWKGSQGASDYELRQYVIEAMVALKAKRTIPLLQEALQNDPHEAVRKAAAEGLKAFEVEGVEVPEASPTRLEGSPDPVTARATILPERLRIVTSKGTMVVELFTDVAPVHCYNIVSLARAGFYDDLRFHRVVPAFVIQGADPRGTGWGDPGYTVNNEVNPNRYVKGTMGMPDAGLDTGGCQIFINHLPTPHLDGRYTTFGRVVQGLEVIDQVEVGDVIHTIEVDETP